MVSAVLLKHILHVRHLAHMRVSMSEETRLSLDMLVSHVQVIFFI